MVNRAKLRLDVLLVLVVSTAWLSHGGGTPAAEDPREAARLYTNADLAKFEPHDPEPSGGDREAQDAEAWAFVEAFLDRERRALDATRRLDLERAAVEESARERERRRVRYSPFLGVFGRKCLARPFGSPKSHAPTPTPPRLVSPHGRPFDPRRFMDRRPTLGGPGFSRGTPAGPGNRRPAGSS